MKVYQLKKMMYGGEPVQTCICGKTLIKSTPQGKVLLHRYLEIIGDKIVAKCMSCKRYVEIPPDVFPKKRFRLVVKKNKKKR